MTNQTMNRRVATRGSATEPTQRVSTPDAGAEFEELFRTCVINMARSCTHVPAAIRQEIYDLARTNSHKRHASLAKIGALLAVCLEDPSLTEHAIEQFTLRIEAYLRARRPLPVNCMLDAWRDETLAQANADIAQAGAVHALQTRDVVSLERAIEATTIDVARGRHILALLTAHHRQLMLSGGHRRIA